MRTIGRDTDNNLLVALSQEEERAFSERPEPRELFVLARTICEEAQGTDDIVQVRSDVIRLYNIVVQMTDDNERLRAVLDAAIVTLKDVGGVMSTAMAMNFDEITLVCGVIAKTLADLRQKQGEGE